MIKVSGNRISPTEIEEAALASGAVREALALGVPDERLGQAIVLVAVAKGDDAEQRLRAYFRRELPALHAAARDRLAATRCRSARTASSTAPRWQGGVRMKAMGPIPPGFSAERRRPAADRRLDGRGAGRRRPAARRCSSTTTISSAARSPASGLRCPTELALHYAVKANPYAPLLEVSCTLCRRLRRRLGGRAAALEDADIVGLPISFAGPGKRDAGDGERRSAPASPSTSKARARRSGRWRSAERDGLTAEAGGPGQSAVRAQGLGHEDGRPAQPVRGRP